MFLENCGGTRLTPMSEEYSGSEEAVWGGDCRRRE